MNKVVFKSTMMQTVYDFCLKTLKDLVKEHEDEVFNYQVSVDIAPSLNEAKGSVESSIDTLSEDELKDRRRVKEVAAHAVDVTKNIPFATKATMIKRGSRIFVKDANIVIVGNADLIRINMLCNLYRFEEWLKNDITTQLKHEFGHVLHYIELDGTPYSEWYDNFKIDNKGYEDFYKWRDESKENNTFTVEEGVARYYSIPGEARANALGNVTLDDLLQIEKVNGNKESYTIEVKSYKK